MSPALSRKPERYGDLYGGSCGRQIPRSAAHSRDKNYVPFQRLEAKFSGRHSCDNEGLRSKRVGGSNPLGRTINLPVINHLCKGDGSVSRLGPYQKTISRIKTERLLSEQKHPLRKCPQAKFGLNRSGTFGDRVLASSAGGRSPRSAHACLVTSKNAVPGWSPEHSADCRRPILQGSHFTLEASPMGAERGRAAVRRNSAAIHVQFSCLGY